MGGFFGFCFLALAVVLGVLGFSRTGRLRRELEELRRQMQSLRDELKKPERQKTAPEKEAFIPSQPVSVRVVEPAVTAPVERVMDLPLPRSSVPKQEEKTVPPPKRPSQSLELNLGTRWLNWVGIAMLILGIAFFLKYAYDNAWIGPQGRLAIGVVLGVVALGIGERFRRKDWSILFQVLTGGGLAIFYLCIFFSFHLYHFSGSTVSMLLAVLVTALAVILAVSYNAVSIAILAVIGGFLSPILFSTGENHPYALFIYIAILDMVAMGAAWFRRWRALDLLCFFSTIMMYLGWHGKFYAPDQIIPALIFTTLFYLMFLIIPTLYSLVHRLTESSEGIVLLVMSALFAFFSYSDILYREYRPLLGLAVIGQALIVFLLFQIWNRRMGKESHAAASFLIITLGLVIIAIPIQLKLYGIPLAWSAEGCVMVFLGIRFNQMICKIGGVIALALAAIGVLFRLPLHTTFFIPVFNISFGSWIFVITMTRISAYLFYKKREGQEELHNPLAGICFALGLFLICILCSLEVSQSWTLNYPGLYYQTYRSSSLVLLWSLIPLITTWILVKIKAKSWMPLSWIAFGIGGIFWFAGLAHYHYPSPWLVLNVSFLPFLVFILAFWAGARLCRNIDLKQTADVYSVAGHVFLAILVAMECSRWSHYSSAISPKMGISLISAAWAVQAFIVLWIGLAKRSPFLRYMGFALFLLAVGKTLIIDTSELEKVYRIVSFAACGLLLLAGGYFYQHYSSKIIEKLDTEAKQ